MIHILRTFVHLRVLRGRSNSWHQNQALNLLAASGPYFNTKKQLLIVKCQKVDLWSSSGQVFHNPSHRPISASGSSRCSGTRNHPHSGHDHSFGHLRFVVSSGAGDDALSGRFFAVSDAGSGAAPPHRRPVWETGPTSRRGRRVDRTLQSQPARKPA